MDSHIVRRSTLAFAALMGLSLLSACQDKRVQQLQSGITRDSVLSVTAKGTQGADSMPSIYSTDRYLVNGKTLEVLYFDAKNRKAGGPDTVPLSKLTPLVMYDGTLIGKGWTAWDSIAKANNIKLAKH